MIKHVTSADELKAALELKALAYKNNASVTLNDYASDINGDINLSQTINDTISGQQSSSLTANQQASLDATQTVMTGLMTGQYSQNPIKVVRVSGQRECDCDSCGGCR